MGVKASGMCTHTHIIVLGVGYLFCRTQGNKGRRMLVGGALDGSDGQ